MGRVRCPGVYVPYAKAFGTLLDLNCSIILLPMLRTLMSVLYNASADQSCGSKTVRALLWLFPLHENVTFHKVVPLLLMACACSVCHDAS